MDANLPGGSIVLSIGLALLVSASPGGAETSSGIIQLGSRRELFVDRYLIDRLEGSRLVLHRPHDEGAVLKFDKPWEGPFCGYCTVIKHDGKFRLYYRGRPEAGADGSPDEVTCYAESTDGSRWTKPELGLFEVHGTRRNNVILAGHAPVGHNFSPFLDTRPGAAAARRFKALGGTRKSGLIAYVSPDGVRWKRLRDQPVFRKGMFDSQNVAFWSEAERRYVCYFRIWSSGGFRGYRSVGRTTSKDFVHWTEPVAMSFGEAPREHIYTNQTHPYFRAPHIYISIAARFMPGRQVLTPQEARKLRVHPQYFKDCSDAVLMTSRGGGAYDRTFMESFIRPGIGVKNWASRSNYPALNVVQTGPTEMSVYANCHYAQPTAHLRRYSLRLDGFASVRASYKGGQMTTRPFTFKGRRLLMNFATSAAGGIRVEIRDAGGKPIPGHTLADSRERIGNEIERAAAWAGGEDIGKLAGKPVRLHFVMKDADLYSIRFE